MKKKSAKPITEKMPLYICTSQGIFKDGEKIYPKPTMSNQRPDWEKFTFEHFKRFFYPVIDLDEGKPDNSEMRAARCMRYFVRPLIKQELTKARQEAIEECIAVINFDHSDLYSDGNWERLEQKLKGLKNE